MGPLAEIKRTSSFHPTPHFFDGHRRPRLYRTYILNQLISLFKYPFELSAKPNLGGTGGHFDPPIVQTSPHCVPCIETRSRWPARPGALGSPFSTSTTSPYRLDRPTARGHFRCRVGPAAMARS